MEDSVSNKDKPELSAYLEVMASLLESSKTLSLATLNDQQYPEISLVPFLYHEGLFYIYVSDLSLHTQHLLNNPICSLLLYRNEEKPKNYFSIERMTVVCQAKSQELNRENILEMMIEKLGNTMKLLRQLGDFRLFSLSPEEGRLVTGFGKAFDIRFSDLSLRHVVSSK